MDTQMNARDKSSPIVRPMVFEQPQNSFHQRPDTSANILTSSRHQVIYPLQSDRELPTQPLFSQTMGAGLTLPGQAGVKHQPTSALNVLRRIPSEAEPKQ